MKLQEVKEIAKSHHLKLAGLSKSDLIRNIQRAEGNADCFAGPASSNCDQQQCLWRQDCLAKA